MKQFLCLFLIAAILTGCGQRIRPTLEDSSGPSVTDGTEVTTPTGETARPDVSQNDKEMFTDRDQNSGYDPSKCVTITLNGSSAAASSNSVVISGSTVTITEEATYLISGTLDNGMLIVNCNEKAKPQLILNGVSITSETSAALYILCADKVFLTLAENSENSLTNGGSFFPIDESNIDAALYSREDLTINGSGTLAVTSPVGHGIVCKDDLVFTGGICSVYAASHGLDVNDSLRMTNTSLTVDAGKDGIHAENSDNAELGFVYLAGGNIKIEAEGDGISAGHYVTIYATTLSLLCGGGSANGSKEHSDSFGGFGGGPGGGGGRPWGVSSTGSADDGTSMKGIKAGTDILIESGIITIDSADDSLHCANELTVNGGTLQLKSGDDGIHSDSTLHITSGSITITESYEGLEAQQIYVSGGEISIVASDDGLNAAGGTDSSGEGGRDNQFGGHGGMGGNSNGYIAISGGDLYINASGDGLDANGSLLISGGYTVVCGPTSGDTAVLDFDKSGTITGGTFIGTGSTMMAQTLTGDTQGVLAVKGSFSAGTNIVLTDLNGNILLDYTPALAFQLMIFSTPEMVKGQQYTITVGSDSGTFEAN